MKQILMMNKSGKRDRKVMGWIIGMVIAVVVVIVVLALIPQRVEDVERITDCPDSTGVLTVQDYSALPSGTDPGSPTLTAGINGGVVSTTITSGTTAFPIGSTIEVIAVITDYLDESWTFTMPCGGYTLEAPMYYSTADNPVIRMQNDDGDFMTDDIAGGAVNQTDLSTGETLILEVEFQGTNGESSGDGIWVIEFNTSTSANITSVLLDGRSPIAIPSVHVLNNAASKAVAFEISAVVGATKNTYTLTVVLGAGKDLEGRVYTDFYAKQKFIDDDKSIKYGIQDSDGTAVYENTVDFDFFINAA